MTINCTQWWGNTSGALWSVQYHFVAITSWSTLTQNKSTCQGPFYGLNGSAWESIFRESNGVSQKFYNVLVTLFYSSSYNKSNQAFKVEAIMLLSLKLPFRQFFEPTLILVLSFDTKNSFTEVSSTS